MNAPIPLYTWFYEKLTTSILLENTFETLLHRKNLIAMINDYAHFVSSLKSSNQTIQCEFL